MWNPLELSLGDKVSYNHTSILQYDSKGIKKTQNIEHETQEGVVVGVRYKMEGEYIPAYNYALDDYGPASFIATKRINFYEVRNKLNGPISLVLPNHIESKPE